MDIPLAIFAKKYNHERDEGVVGWCDGPGYTSSAGASYNLDYSRARAYCASSRCGLFGHFFSHLSFLFLAPSLCETGVVGWCDGAG